MPYFLVHRLAVALLVVTAFVGATASFIFLENLVPLPMRIGQTLLVGALWGFLALKVWKRPHTWSLGVALLITASFLFQVYLWATGSLAVASRAEGFPPGLPGLILRVPVALAAVSCFWLYWQSRKIARRDEA